MSETIHCKIMPQIVAEADQKNYRTDRRHYKVATIKISRAAKPNSPEIHTIASPKDFFFQMGDRIEAVTATVGVWIKPQTSAGMFVLRPSVAHNSNYRLRKELEINLETTKQIHRGQVSVAKDIGSTTSFIGAVTR